MTAQFEPQLSVLPEAQQRLWRSLAPAARLGFVLYGGTAIALRLGHRQSVDFDFFTEQSLDKSRIRTAFPFLERSRVLQDEPTALSVNVSDEEIPGQFVKVSFFGPVRFGRYGSPETTRDGVLEVASLDDLMATKTKVILQRVEAKDYRDIAAMLAAGVALDRGLAIAQAMYGNQFQPSESLKAMTYFEGGDLHLLSDVEKNTLIRAASAVRQLPKVSRLSRKLTG